MEYDLNVRVVKQPTAAWSSQSNDGESPGPEAEVRPGRFVSTVPGQKPEQARILIIEDHAFVRHALVGLINAQSDLVCCGESDSIAASLPTANREKPDAILMDLRLKDGEALELIEGLHCLCPGVPILVLSQCDETQYAEKVIRAGATGFLMKEEAAEEVLNALRTVISGRVYLSRTMQARRLSHPQPGGFPVSASADASCAENPA